MEVSVTFTPPLIYPPVKGLPVPTGWEGARPGGPQTRPDIFKERESRAPDKNQKTISLPSNP